MLLKPRPKLALEAIGSAGSASSAIVLSRPTANDVPRPRRPVSSFRYYGIAPTARIPWLALLLSAGLHALLLLGFNRHQPVHRISTRDDTVAEIMMMPVLDDPADDKPKELDDSDTEAAPSVSVPMLADIPSRVSVDTAFTQPLDLTIPLKSDPNAARVVSIPVNIQRGQLDGRGIKDLFNLSELDRRPVPIVQISPRFPNEMKLLGVNGRVRVGFIVDREGNVIRAYVVSSTRGAFEDSAIEAILKWKFRPGMKNGRKVNSRVEQPLDFTVSNDAS
jgi:protein TonB